MDLRLYFLLIPFTFDTYLKRNMNNKSSMDLRLYFLLIPPILMSYLRGNIDNRSAMDPGASRSLSLPASQPAIQPF